MEELIQRRIETPIGTGIEIHRQLSPILTDSAHQFLIEDLLQFPGGDHPTQPQFEPASGTCHLVDRATGDHLSSDDHRDLVDQVLQLQQIVG